ncbi:MAG: protein-export chaperone SecB [Desulfuromusa sp.]|jgi:preprotein translocase subunit SecB|nr:protein-export chaperone SecB [Desulfuromusa sp.]
MENNDSITSFGYHPIQLNNIFVRELHIVANNPPDEEVGVAGDKIAFLTGHTEYDQEDQEISVSAKIECGFEEENDQPYSIRIAIVGSFHVDEDKFDVKDLEDWARRNAPLILFPYLREHAYALTSRCGFKPLILPLMEVPTFRKPRKENQE